MTRQAIDRLGAMLYGLLILGIPNSFIRREVSRETRDSWPVFIVLLAVNLVGVIILFYCLYIFIRHLFTENKRVGVAGKALWLALLLLGNFVAMPAYWYVYLVRERLAAEERSSSELAEATPATSRPAY